jgi:hypothetical protein
MSIGRKSCPVSLRISFHFFPALPFPTMKRTKLSILPKEITSVFLSQSWPQTDSRMLLQVILWSRNVCLPLLSRTQILTLLQYFPNQRWVFEEIVQGRPLSAEYGSNVDGQPFNDFVDGTDPQSFCHLCAVKL